ncbi:palindromic element RPE1 domain-containing protein [Rickettsia conorii subsp. heilongjiangensis]|nr:palindromic element RPE1 domain-containing protein [Rickettsia conorii]UZW39301.1 palindromic element RPE1 domain-containing protein [Rickettsia conorii subsp. heilongjiangensis]
MCKLFYKEEFERNTERSTAAYT